MISKNGKLALGLLVAFHVVIATWFAMVTPFRTEGILMGSRDPSTGLRQTAKDIGAPDERQHVNYIRRLAMGKGLPVFNPKDPNLYETYQSHQPPLYYGVALAWSKVFAPSLSDNSTDEFAVAANVGVPLRLLNAILGAATVFGTFLLALWGLGNERLGIIASGFVASLPMFGALSGAVSNDPLLIALCTYALAIVCRSVRNGWDVPNAITIGVLMGAGMMTKTTGIALWPVLAVACLVSADRKQSIRLGAMAFGISLSIAMPWWIRNQGLYGDPLAIKAFSQAFVGSAQASVFIEGLGPWGYWGSMVAWWTARSFVGIFGYMDIALSETTIPGANTPNSLYRVILAFLALVFCAYLASLREDSENVNRRVHLVMGVFTLVVVLLFLRFNSQYFQAQARYLMPAIGPIACAYSGGLIYLLKNRAKLAAGITIGLLGGTTLYALSMLPAEFARRMTSGATK